jgi:uncharacterized protein (TIGR03435 family)
MVRPAFFAVLAFVALSRAQGQEGAPVFEVASVKFATTGQYGVDFRVYPGGRLSVRDMGLGQIILRAFQIKRYQLSGGPVWLWDYGLEACYDIEAKAAADASREQVMAMLRTLLAERFRLKTHREAHEGTVYSLEVGKGGPKLKESTADTSWVRLMRNTPPELPGVSYTIRAQKASMPYLAEQLGSMGISRPILDRTGLKGEYDFKIDYAIDDNPETGPSIFSAIQEQLGLKLEAGKGPVETLVIESVDRIPTGN